MTSKKPRKSGEAPSGQAGGFKYTAHSRLKDSNESIVPRQKIRSAMIRDGQNATVQEVMRRQPVNAFELCRMGMASPAAYIQYLEAMGYFIDSARIVATDNDGFLHSGVALYSFVCEPDVLEVAE